MTVNLPIGVEERLRELAIRQGQDIDALLEEAVCQYLEAAAITDVDSAEVPETQVALVNELRGIPAWEGDPE